MSFSYTFQTRWADMDPNQHLRHTAYNDYAAQVRVNLFTDFDLPISTLMEMGIGPVLFREDTRFVREVRLNEKIKVTCSLAGMKQNGVQWHFFHQFYKEDGKVAATIRVEGAWLDLHRRKLKAPPADLLKIMKDKMPRSKDFKWL